MPTRSDWEEMQVADAEYRRENPQVLTTAECDGRAADEAYGRYVDDGPVGWPVSRYWPTT